MRLWDKVTAGLKRLFGGGAATQNDAAAQDNGSVTPSSSSPEGRESVEEASTASRMPAGKLTEFQKAALFSQTPDQKGRVEEGRELREYFRKGGKIDQVADAAGNLAEHYAALGGAGAIAEFAGRGGGGYQHKRMTRERHLTRLSMSGVLTKIYSRI